MCFSYVVGCVAQGGHLQSNTSPHCFGIIPFLRLNKILFLRPGLLPFSPSSLHLNSKCTSAILISLKEKLAGEGVYRKHQFPISLHMLSTDNSLKFMPSPLLPMPSMSRPSPFSYIPPLFICRKLAFVFVLLTLHAQILSGGEIEV